MIFKQNRESLDWGLDTTNSPVIGGAPGYVLHPPPGSDDAARFRVCSSRLWRSWESSALPTGASGII